jgi:NTE family protein
MQGGGALGSYQAGVYEALAEAAAEPDWVAGVSIGAINASIIAGNPPERRVEQLRRFWSRITAPTAAFTPLQLSGLGLPRLEAWAAGLGQTLGTAGAVLFGQPGFFRPRSPLEWLAPTPTVSFYDQAELKSTLEELVDFDRIAAGVTRLSVGAVHVETGNLIYFDNVQMRGERRRLGPEHVMASGALPPGLPAVEIEGEFYWDGGIVSNTPLQFVLAERPRQPSLVFQVDLFPARGKRPENLDEVGERDKDIRYSSRTRTGTNDAAENQNIRRQLRQFLDRLPPELARDPVAGRLREYACGALIDVVQLIYRPERPQGAQKDLHFDRGTMKRRWAQGLHDARRSLEVAPWREPAPPDAGFRSFDVFAPPPAAAPLRAQHAAGDGQGATRGADRAA